MFDVAPTELLLVAVVALVVIGPKDLPRAMRFVGRWVGKARGVARHFRSGLDEMVRQAELEEMEKKWAEQNARIMAAYPTLQDTKDLPQVPAAVPAAAPGDVPATDPAGQAAQPAYAQRPPLATEGAPGASAAAAPAPAAQATHDLGALTEIESIRRS